MDTVDTIAVEIERQWDVYYSVVINPLSISAYITFDNDDGAHAGSKVIFSMLIKEFVLCLV